jgi:ATP-binding cassette subfamily B protein
MRDRVFVGRTRAALAARLRSVARSELAGEVQRGMPQLLQAGILVFAVIQFLRLVGSGEQAAVGAAVVAVITFVPMMLAPIQQMISFYNAVIASVPPIVEVVSALRAEEEIREAPDAGALTVGSGTVAMKEVDVNAPDGPAVILHDVTHEFEGNRVWGLVGRSGCGKSTLLATLARVADPSRGAVSIDGLDLRQVQLSGLRQAIAFMGQFALFVDGTVRDNLNLATTPVTDEVLLEACRATGMLERLQELAAPAPALDLVIYAEPNKGALSGGERRLLALTRVLAHPARIVLLDEPTAGVDTTMRSRIIDVIRVRLAGMTVIVVDHDPEFIAEVSDAVVCMDQGTIVTWVPRAELLERPSPFLDLLRSHRRITGEGMTTTSFPPA